MRAFLYGVFLQWKLDIRSRTLLITCYLVPLLFRSEQITEELSAATLCKGLHINRERSCYVEVKLQAADYLYLAGLLAVSGILLYVNSHIYLL